MRDRMPERMYDITRLVIHLNVTDDRDNVYQESLIIFLYILLPYALALYIFRTLLVVIF